MQKNYFDHNATTAIDKKVLGVMLPYIEMQQGNPTSQHSFGRYARTAIEEAREQVALAIHAHPSEVIFTSGGTEANNMIVHGAAIKERESTLVRSNIEHPCVARPMEAMKYQGWKQALLNVSQDGVVTKEAYKNISAENISLVSVMLANNETGAIQDMALLHDFAKEKKALSHTDAVQAFGKIDVRFDELHIDAMTLSSHKIYGPQGVGALILNKRSDIEPLIYGGGQEKNLRSGTENIAAIVGFGKACELISESMKATSTHTHELKKILEVHLKDLGAVIFSEKVARLNNTTFFAFKDIEGSTLLTALDKKGFAIASGSACSSVNKEPSHVLLAMGIGEDLARGALRISFGQKNSMTEVKDFVEVLKKELQTLKQLTAIAA
ncbi:cysteine desulfurase family protein [Candidatus Methylopumilus planktonicus]|uniref:cysteine desulfurase family protein n=1 Tax=Candidatus Methylopumilus planktonicus TaxID=1581557 RepID=UPI0011225BC2|nr:cysteine desulfurase family protein [Candidatus Methylopumilus planktonicus]QDD11126.1 cysteine desulfurase [Candidatus Methylopumilus planktonicus]QDD23596.1 cysteine desulfurase [Candidatus Methylopumilus planktonicus]